MEIKLEDKYTLQKGVRFFSKDKIEKLSSGFKNLDIESFEEGNFPRKLFIVYNKKI